ncbi:hypothetical protein [endosymbiont of Lamellibrachia barhami]|uniref:hypothetical protein n=1 Tax=endosymbiont of Lamellibrachia barhami TaxID=205975 RepID=UPI0015AE7C86|nr:hypothetical protein [endosymbiont of Lamellibrachia barhami]
MSKYLVHAIDDYRAFGFRINNGNRNNQTVIVDSEMSLDSLCPMNRVGYRSGIVFGAILRN